MKQFFNIKVTNILKRCVAVLVIVTLIATLVPTSVLAEEWNTLLAETPSQAYLNEQGNQPENTETKSETSSENPIVENSTIESEESEEKTDLIDIDLSVSDMPEDLIESAEIDTAKIKGLDDMDSTDLYSITTVNEDQSKSLHIFDAPVKYYDKENNRIRFINSALKKSDKKSIKNGTYAYENTENNLKVYLPKTSDEYTLIETDNGDTLEFKPIGKTTSKADLAKIQFLSEEEHVVEYKHVFDNNYDLHLIPQNDGVKENIFIKKDRGIYSFDFEFKAPGLIPAIIEQDTEHIPEEKSKEDAKDQPQKNANDRNKANAEEENEETIKLITEGDADGILEGKTIAFIREDTEEVVFHFGELFIRDSYTGNPDSNDHHSYENNYRVEQLGDSKYRVTYVLDQEFLSKKSTVYPVLVDPAISPITAIHDAPVYSLRPKENLNANAWIQLGNIGGTYGQGHGYFQTTSMKNYTYINPNKITKAVLRVYEGSGTTYASTIRAYDTDSTWKDTSITWNNKPATYGSALSSISISKSDYYEFTITSTVKEWLRDELWEGGWETNYGVALVPSSTSTGRKDFCSSNYGTTSRRPSIKIDYEEDTSLSDGTYFMENYNSVLFLDANTATDRARQATITRTDKQQWVVTHKGNGYYTITNKWYGANGHLSVWDPTVSTPVADIWDVSYATGGDFVRYKIIKNNDGSGTYRLMPQVLDNLKALCINNGSTSSGTAASYSAYKGDYKSCWKFVSASTRYTLPDLEVRTITTPTINAPSTSERTFSAQIYNQYSKAISTTTKFEFLDSSNNVLSTKTVATSALEGNASTTVSTTWSPPKSGTYQVRVTADSAGKVAEYSESNAKTQSFSATNVVKATVSPVSSALFINETKQLSVTLEPSNLANKAVTWSSSNTNVATVSTNGLVTAKGGWYGNDYGHIQCR